VSDKPEAWTLASAGHDGSVTFNGQPVYPTAATLEMRVGHLPKLRLEIDVIDLVCDIHDPTVEIPAHTRDLLVRLGWTPPVGEQ
jgi:hypothetical protein